MKTIELSQIAMLAPFLQSGTQEPLFVTQNGRTIAAITRADEDDAQSLLLSVHPEFQGILDRSQQRLESEGAVTSDDVRKRLGLPPAESRG